MHVHLVWVRLRVPPRAWGKDTVCRTVGRSGCGWRGATNGRRAGGGAVGGRAPVGRRRVAHAIQRSCHSRCRPRIGFVRSSFFSKFCPGEEDFAHPADGVGRRIVSGDPKFTSTPEAEPNKTCDHVHPNLGRPFSDEVLNTHTFRRMRGIHFQVRALTTHCQGTKCMPRRRVNMGDPPPATSCGAPLEIPTPDTSQHLVARRDAGCLAPHEDVAAPRRKGGGARPRAVHATHGAPPRLHPGRGHCTRNGAGSHSWLKSPATERPSKPASLFVQPCKSSNPIPGADTRHPHAPLHVCVCVCKREGGLDGQLRRSTRRFNAGGQVSGPTLRANSGSQQGVVENQQVVTQRKACLLEFGQRFHTVGSGPMLMKRRGSKVSHRTPRRSGLDLLTPHGRANNACDRTRPPSRSAPNTSDNASCARFAPPP